MWGTTAHTDSSFCGVWKPPVMKVTVSSVLVLLDFVFQEIAQNFCAILIRVCRQSIVRTNKKYLVELITIIGNPANKHLDVYNITKNMRFKHNNYGFHTNKGQFSQDWGCSQQCNKNGDLTSTLFTCQ